MEENILSLDCFFPVMSTAFSCVLRTLGTSARDKFGPFAAVVASYESSNAHANEGELLGELPPSDGDITVEEGVVEINWIEGMALGTRGAEDAGLHRLGS